LNAWTLQMREDVTETVRSFGADADIKAVVITGAGERAFCAGQDLNETAKFDADNVVPWLDSFKSLFDVILSAPKPVVAALNGVAAGSGYQLAMVCDYRIAHDGVRIGQPEVNSGIPSITGHFLTQYSLGHSRTADMMLSGRLLGADEAHRVGLVHSLVAPEDVLKAAMDRADDLAGRPKLAFQLTKQRIRDVLWPGLLEAFEAGIEIDRKAWASGEPQETARKFFAARGSSIKASAR
jgi:enoyl-CoA hydratase/carnithine racemase